MEYELEFYENPNDNTDYYFRAVADGIVIDKFDVDDAQLSKNIWIIKKEH